MKRKHILWIDDARTIAMLLVILGHCAYTNLMTPYGGMNYPVYSPQRILDFFAQERDKEFVCGYNVTACPYDMHLHKVKNYHFFRDVPLPHNSFLRRALIGGSMLLLKYLGIRRKPYLMVDGKQWDVFFGSQWIGLTKGCAEYVLNQLQTNKPLVRLFKSSYAPDDLCVPTIVMNSPFSEKAIRVTNLDFAGATPLHYLTYKDYIWSYDETDFTVIMSSGKMFVRKIISGKSEKLIEMIKETWR